ncbi:MAG: hypothetical protein KDE22_14890, partial [Rhodobacterales bacterium]|nr:hypothetical protein [Rhodobacterales bacterium]
MAGRVLTWVKRGVLALLGLLVLAGVGGAAAFWWLTGTEGGRARLVGWIEDAANDPAGGLTVSIGAIGPGLPGHLALADLRVADGQGAWLTVPSLSLTWSPWALLVDRHLVVSDITVTEPVLDRLPAAGAAEAPPEAAEPFALPELPVDVTVVALAVTGARMGAAVAGQAATLDLQAD